MSRKGAFENIFDVILWVIIVALGIIGIYLMIKKYGG